jgi:hypothetical protein
MKPACANEAYKTPADELVAKKGTLRGGLQCRRGPFMTASVPTQQDCRRFAAEQTPFPTLFRRSAFCCGLRLPLCASAIRGQRIVQQQAGRQHEARRQLHHSDSFLKPPAAQRRGLRSALSGCLANFLRPPRLSAEGRAFPNRVYDRNPKSWYWDSKCCVANRCRASFPEDACC